ncbi:MAG: hypothetical protein ACRDZY_02270 [Acidimicrobiales bacterium]
MPSTELEPWRPGPVARRAAVSPISAGVVAGGALIGLAAQSVAVGVLVAVLAWVVRMAVALGRSAARRALAPEPPQLDPWSVRPPWRQYVTDAAAAQRSFTQTVDAWPPGPIRERLVEVRGQVDGAAAEIGRLAAQGSGLAPADLDARIQTQRDQLARVQEEHRDGTEEATLAAQLRAAISQRDAADSLTGRLATLTAELSGAVTQLARLSVQTGDLDQLAPVASSVTSVSTQLEALRLAIEEVSGSRPEGPSGPSSGEQGADP